MPRASLFTQPPERPLVGASILSADFASLGSESRAVLESGADFLHLDVMDGHFVPNLTMGPALCRSLRRELPDAFLDVHLMVTDPAMFVQPFADAGADHFTFHIEAVPEPEPLAATTREAGMTAGLAINPDTPFTAIEPYLDSFDLVLVMSVHPGFSGQAFIDRVLATVRVTAARLRPDQRLEMDGGINGQTAAACRDAGCDTLVAASAIFGSDDYAAAVARVRGETRVSSGS